MDLLEKKNFYNSLFDFYGVLLTDKQQTYFQQYYFEDLSLAEIASMHQVSRNAVFDQLKKTYAALEQYEEKLGLLSQAKSRSEVLDGYGNSNNSEVLELIEKLKNLEL